jgi:hypothetical protein
VTQHNRPDSQMIRARSWHTTGVATLPRREITTPSTSQRWCCLRFE